ncbi:hypothetical protein HXX76_013892 [Chlamydomonas incerta]|uniref:Thioesterase domain-containing protein n=1 Tax=Chlamydomonas incerta TaxID=51695 RepID=A0A835SD86_CHLIN|nr:hypothetical protein HXX76_013892 [Chlamydomonas incerta]|eukprot:KAG2425138.1 hypothetical protein HXX76_013892 [Chlamydomonas incerta]
MMHSATKLHSARPGQHRQQAASALRHPKRAGYALLSRPSGCRAGVVRNPVAQYHVVCAAAAAGAAPGSSQPQQSDLVTVTGPPLTPEVAALFPGGEFSEHMQVRDYELDQFNVVNNAVYSSYFQHGRHEALAMLGHDVDAYARDGTPLALSQLNIAFRAPLRSRDRFRVTVAVAKVTAARLVLNQRILRQVPGGGEELSASAEATVVFLDSRYAAARVPKPVARLFQALADMQLSSPSSTGAAGGTK